MTPALTLKDLRAGDFIELYGDPEFRAMLRDEFDIYPENDTFVYDEDDYDPTPFSFVSKVWREDPSGNYILIFNRPSHDAHEEH